MYSTDASAQYDNDAIRMHTDAERVCNTVWSAMYNTLMPHNHIYEYYEFIHEHYASNKFFSCNILYIYTVIF